MFVDQVNPAMIGTDPKNTLIILNNRVDNIIIDPKVSRTGIKVFKCPAFTFEKIYSVCRTCRVYP